MKALHAIEDRSVIDAPLTSFSQCHSGILGRLQSLTALPELAVAAQRSRAIATDTLALFGKAIMEHHADEENELFPAVLHSAAKGEEKLRVATIVRRLVSEHRAIEAAWKTLKPGVEAAASSKPGALDAQEVAALVDAYVAHARYEEQEFLPLAETILGRDANHLAALGLSLHLRHSPMAYGYI
ncbi:MAG TPA: hemerythrin domain-containing protein [Burkholderiaceae bacterium]|nr:hemerythrin domain-containing protein [Burkholderiaceae bacterium]